jgi:hypothetical protein
MYHYQYRILSILILFHLFSEQLFFSRSLVALQLRQVCPFGTGFASNISNIAVYIRVDRLKIKILRGKRMKRLIIAILMLLTISNMLIADELEERFNTLETEIEKLKIETVDNNPYATGETLNWGKGLFMDFQLSPKRTGSIEIGYNFVLEKWKPPMNGPYLQDRRGYKIGISLGSQSSFNELTLVEEDKSFLTSSGYAFFGKLSLSSPVLLNFISTNTYIKPMYIIGANTNEGSFANEEFGIGFGGEVEFWISKKQSFYLGFKAEGSFDAFADKVEENNRSILPWNYYPTFGIRLHF